jgi:hypothetical protein
MTLIVTQVTPDGIAMAADAAVTETWLGYGRVLHGATKLFAHQPSGSGIGIWGEAVLASPDSRKHPTPIPLEFALRYFLDRNQATTPARLVQAMTEWLINEFPSPKRAMGIDIASCERVVDGFRPTIFRIANCAYPYVDQVVTRFRYERLRAPIAFDPVQDRFFTVAGTLNAEFWVEEFSLAIGRATLRTHSAVRAGTLKQQCRYLQALVRSIADIQSTTGLNDTIGGAIATLGISSRDGIISLF